MHLVLLYHIGNVLFLVLHTGMATGIRTASFPTSRSRCVRVEITPFEPDQRPYLRREAPAFFVTSFPPSLLHEGGRYRITNHLFYTAFRQGWGINKYVYSKGWVPIHCTHLFRSNFIAPGTLLKVLLRVLSR